MNKPLKDLGNEHGAILIFLIIARKLADRLITPVMVDRSDLEAAIDFVRTFADKCHHGKEENIIFPWLLSKSPKNAVLVNELLGEHKTARDYIRGVVEALPNYSPGNPEAWRISHHLIAYVDLLHQHIRTEAEQMFTLMESQLTPAEAENMQTDFDRIEQEVIGGGKHEAYRQWLKEMENKYR